MKRILSLFAFVLFIALVFSACSRSITPFQAANGKAKCGRSLR